MFRNNVLIIAGTVIVLAVLTVFTIVLITGSDSDKLVEFLKWLLYVLPTGIVGLLIAKNNATISNQVASVGAGVSNVETATNGMLTARLLAQTDELKTHVDNALANAITNAPAVPPDYTHTTNVVG